MCHYADFWLYARGSVSKHGERQTTSKAAGRHHVFSTWERDGNTSRMEEKRVG